MASVFNIYNRSLLNRVLLTRYKNIWVKCLSTSRNHKKEITPDAQGKSQFQNIPDFSKPLENKNWISYGFDYEDEKKDRVELHSVMFVIFSIVFVSVGVFYVYMPDFNHKDWARREAFIRLHEREQAGLEPIDPNYVDPSKVVLPSDEKLGDFEIII